MGKGYTSLFFLDEVTALAAGHRPCFFCRRRDAKAFLGNRKVEGFDRQLHRERLASFLPLREAGRVVSGANRVGFEPGTFPHPSRVPRDTLPTLRVKRDDLPDGTMIEIDGAAFAVRGAGFLRWSFAGYVEYLPRRSNPRGKVLTAPSITAILATGYQPRWHHSALQWGST